MAPTKTFFEFGELSAAIPLTPPRLGYSHASPNTPAQVAELVDALASGASIRKDVEVRVFSWAPFTPNIDEHFPCKTRGLWLFSTHS